MSYAFSKIQKEIIEYNQDELLVRGVAGSGKTLCLLKNAINKSKEESPNTIYFFSYNKTLEKYIENMLESSDNQGIVVRTFHGWALREMRSHYSEFNLLTDKRTIFRYLREAIFETSKEYQGRFVSNKNFEKFLLEEFEYISGQYISDFSEYLTYQRVGRGHEIRLSKNDREEIYRIYEYYQSIKFSRYKYEFSDCAGLLLKNIGKIDLRNKMQRIYIDEAQDLDKAQLLLLKRLAKKSFYVAADKGQKIYKTSYTWKDIGANFLGGRAKILTKSFRTTKEILKLAECLQTKDAIINDSEFQKADFNDMRSGEKPELIYYQNKTSDDRLVNYLDLSYDENINVVVGILTKSWDDANRIEKALKSNNISCEQVKKEKGNTLEPGVKITTKHSSKGLEFDHIIIPNFEFEGVFSEKEIEELDVERRLNYVSFTRAKQFLTIFSHQEKPSIFLEELTSEFYNVIE